MMTGARAMRASWKASRLASTGVRLTCAALLSLAVCAAVRVELVSAQVSSAVVVTEAGIPVVPVPWGLGERALYQVKFSFKSVGEAALTVEPKLDTIRGQETYHLTMSLEGGFLGLSIDDEHQSWLDADQLLTRRFVQDIDEVNYERFRHFEFYPEENRYLQLHDGKSETLASSEPLDDIAFVFFARSLPLNVGDEYTVSRYFKESGNPVIIRVLRREEIEVPAGTFKTIVVQPIIRTTGMFSEDGEAELYYSDDDRRVLVAMKSKMSIGSLSLYLKSYEEGTRLTPWVPQPSVAAALVPGANRD